MIYFIDRAAASTGNNENNAAPWTGSIGHHRPAIMAAFSALLLHVHVPLGHARLATGGNAASLGEQRRLKIAASPLEQWAVKLCGSAGNPDPGGVVNVLGIASDGAVLEPPIYKTDTRQRIVRERRELWFEALCDSRLTPEFVASLQRALAVRGLYAGPVTGSVDARTRNAIRSYQKAQGLDSAVLSLAAARQLGLVTIDRPEGLARPNG